MERLLLVEMAVKLCGTGVSSKPFEARNRIVVPVGISSVTPGCFAESTTGLISEGDAAAPGGKSSVHALFAPSAALQSQLALSVIPMHHVLALLLTSTSTARLSVMAWERPRLVRFKTSEVALASRRLSSKAVKDGADKVTTIASMAVVIISSMRVKPL